MNIKTWSQRLFEPDNRNIQTAMEAEIAELRKYVENLELEMMNKNEIIQQWKGKAILNADYHDAKACSRVTK